MKVYTLIEVEVASGLHYEGVRNIYTTREAAEARANQLRERHMGSRDLSWRVEGHEVLA